MNEDVNAAFIFQGLEPSAPMKRAYHKGYSGTRKPHYSNRQLMLSGWFDAGVSDREAGRPPRWPRTAQRTAGI